VRLKKKGYTLETDMLAEIPAVEKAKEAEFARISVANADAREGLYKFDIIICLRSTHRKLTEKRQASNHPLTNPRTHAAFLPGPKKSTTRSLLCSLFISTQHAHTQVFPLV